MKYTAVSVRQLDRKGKPWQAGAKYKDVSGNGKNLFYYTKGGYFSERS